jgi:hypothetical protein
MNFDIETKIESGQIDLNKVKAIKDIIKGIALRIEESGLKKIHVAASVDPPEDISTLSRFLKMNRAVVNEARIIKYCNYLDTVRT